MPPPSAETAHAIRRAHVQQLAHLNVDARRDVPKEPKDDSDGSNDLPSLPPDQLLPVILGWINDNPNAIKAAKDAQCSSASPTTPNWDSVFLAFVESIAMYLRKDDEISKAAQAAREGDHDRALSHLEASEALIHVVAKALDCTFVQLCDFAQKSPDAKAGSSGAYCGLFVSNDHTKPFAGIAFKGSNSDADIATDEDWQPITPLLPDIAWGAKIHEGFYYNLFGDFTANNEVQTPFGVLLKQLSSAYDGQAKLHITGHSLGGGLCTLAYGEFLRRDAEPAFSSFKFGDVYSFAAPRTCFEPFAQEFNARTRAGGGRYSFRIVNKLDPVPTMPPPGPPLDIFFPTANFPFIHVAGGWEITEDRPPQKMADEPPPVAPMSVDDALNKYAFHHDPRKYYESWQNTPHS